MTENTTETTPALNLQRAVVHLASGEVLDLRVANPDMVRWDTTAAKHKWPSMKDAPMLWATFVTWRAATRTGVYTGTFEKWRDEDALDVDLQEAGTADPTRQGAEPDSL